jgi:hypothetical protein
MQHLPLRLLAVGVVALLTAPAAAASQGKAAPNGDARGYWSHERLERAVPRDKAQRDPQGKPPPKGGSGGSTGTPWAGNENVRRTTGKVFFTLSGVNYVCSGSGVVEGNATLSLVLTAGHCVEDGTSGGFATNWVYVPDYERWATKSCTTDPTRCFPAARLVTSSAWASSEDFDYDVAFGVIEGNTLQTTWGTQGIAFNQLRGREMYSFGYPAAGKFNGQVLDYCNGIVVRDRFSYDQGMKCGMTGGSSGGPWYIDFNPTTGLGTANSLNSYKYTNDATTMYGPYFGNYASAVYTSAATGLGSNTAVPPPSSSSLP